MPKELNIVNDGFISPFENQFSTPSFKEHIEKLKNYVNSYKEEGQKTLENFIQGLRNYIKHNNASWYSWCVANWGTKWNAYTQSFEEGNIIFFETAWSPPIPVIMTLSEKYPEIGFILTYADEDSGSNTGRFKFKQGSIVTYTQPSTHSKEGYDIYFELYPEYREGYELVENKYKYIFNE